MYLRPQPPRGLPEAPTHFEELEWAAEYTGDIMFGKPPYSRVRPAAAARLPARRGQPRRARGRRAMRAARAPRAPRPDPGRHRVRRGSAGADHDGQLGRPGAAAARACREGSGRARAVPRHAWSRTPDAAGGGVLAATLPYHALPYAAAPSQAPRARRRWSAST